jgi:ribosomal protein S18 acetylase RimI-like enzyme
VAALVNSAYRGESSRRGWTTEADYIEGQRTDAAVLARDLAATPGAVVLMYREGDDLVGSVWLEPVGEGEAWYLAMLTIRPDAQDRRFGRALLAEAEAWIASRGGRRVRLTVVGIRDSLIAWYERRGYRRTGETRPFPYENREIGAPLRHDLDFVVLEKALQSDGAKAIAPARPD